MVLVSLSSGALKSGCIVVIGTKLRPLDRILCCGSVSCLEERFIIYLDSVAFCVALLAFFSVCLVCLFLNFLSLGAFLLWWAFLVVENFLQHLHMSFSVVFLLPGTFCGLLALILVGFSIQVFVLLLFGGFWILMCGSFQAVVFCGLLICRLL